MHWKVHYKNVSRITNGSHMSNTTRVISVQSRFPTLIQSENCGRGLKLERRLFS